MVIVLFSLWRLVIEGTVALFFFFNYYISHREIMTVPIDFLNM